MIEHQNILVVEVDTETYDEIASVLKRINYAVDRIPNAPTALELVTLVRFRAIIVNHPLKTMPFEDFLAAAKGPQSASREASVGVLASTSNPATDFKVTPDGVDMVIGPDEGQPEREKQLCELLGTVPRAAVRVVVNTDVTLVDHTGESSVAQTKDLSTSGVFAITDRLAPVGSRAQVIFNFPGDQSPFVAEAEIARHAVESAGENQGMGLRFISFRDGHLERLGRFLESLYS